MNNQLGSQLLLDSLVEVNAKTFLKATYSSFVKQGAVQAWQMGFSIDNINIARYLTSHGWIEMYTATNYRFTAAGLEYAAGL